MDDEKTEKPKVEELNHEELRKKTLTEVLNTMGALQKYLNNYFVLCDILKDEKRMTVPTNYLMITTYNCMQALLLSAGMSNIQGVHELNGVAIKTINKVTKPPEGTTIQ